jgi:transposase
MRSALHPSNLIPPGFVADSASSECNQTLVVIHANCDTAACPACGKLSKRIRSHYWRQVSDLPLGGRSVRLVVLVRRFS